MFNEIIIFLILGVSMMWLPFQIRQVELTQDANKAKIRP